MNELIEKAIDLCKKDSELEIERLNDLILSKAKECFGNDISDDIRVVDGRLHIVGTNIFLKLYSERIVQDDISFPIHYFILDNGFVLPIGGHPFRDHLIQKAASEKICNLKSLGGVLLNLDEAGVLEQVAKQ